MARPLAYRSPRRNPPPTGKDKLTGSALTEGSDTYTPAPVVSHAQTPASTLAPALLLALAPIDPNATVRYSDADLQQILKTVQEARLSAPSSAFQPLVFPDTPCKRPLKARFVLR